MVALEVLPVLARLHGRPKNAVRSFSAIWLWVVSSMKWVEEPA